MTRYKSLNYCDKCDSVIRMDELFQFNIQQYIALSEEKLTRRTLDRFTDGYFPAFISVKLLNKYFERQGSKRGTYYV